MRTTQQSGRMFQDTLPGLGLPAKPQQRGFLARVHYWASVEQPSPHSGVSDDICPEGMLVQADDNPPLGSVVTLRLYTDHGDLVLEARVVHDLKGIGFGCRFIHLNEGQWVALRLLNTVKRAPRRAESEDRLAA